MGTAHGKVEGTQSTQKMKLAAPPCEAYKLSFSSAELPSSKSQNSSQELNKSLENVKTSFKKPSGCRFDSLLWSSGKNSRGSKLSKTSRHTASRTTSIKLLSLRSRELIKESWLTVQRWSATTGQSAGMLVFERIFKECPQLRPVFRLTEDEAIDSIDPTHPFLRHTKVFTNIIDLAVRNIDELEMQIAPALITYGRRHFNKHHVGFNPIYLNVFANSIVHVIEAVLGEECDEETSDSWQQLTHYMVLKLQHGYDFEGLNHKKRAIFT